MHFVVGFRQQQNAAGGVLDGGVSRIGMLAHFQKHAAQRLQGELLGEAVQHVPATFVLQRRLPGVCGRTEPSRSWISGTRSGSVSNGLGGVMRNAVLRADDARPEGDRGNVPLAGGPQAQDETQRALGQTGLIGMRHDGRIEQRRRLGRVLVA